MSDIDLTDDESLVHDDKKNSSYPIDPDVFKWTYQALNVLFKFLKLNIVSHADDTAWHDGQIFLFNHFARFEAVIPQYIIYQKTNHLSRSIASKELFSGDELISRYLLNLGGIPNDTNNLMYVVSKDILNDHKLIAFPEGGIVKDRRILDDEGHYRIYSRSDDKRRKLHTGPAVIALTIAIFKSSVRQLVADNQLEQISVWANELGFINAQQLIDASQKKTLITPCNITFYPLRIKPNTVTKVLDFLQTDLKERVSEELLIEGNLLLKESDMDIQLCQPIIVEDYWSRWDDAVASLLVKHSSLSLAELFNTVRKETNWGQQLFNMAHRRNALKIRDRYMHDIYAAVTINIAHIAASLLMHFVQQKKCHVNRKKLHQLLYVCCKLLQKTQSLNFHKTLINPNIYRNILFKGSESFEQFLRSMYTAELISKQGAYYQFTGILDPETEFDSIRHKNPLAVYANEVAPIDAVQQAIKDSLSFKLNRRLDDFADMLFEDDLLEHQWDLKAFQEEKHQEINQQQSIVTSGRPFIIKPESLNGQCAVLIHGLLSTPAEVRTLAEKLAKQGYIVIAPRLKGHGTSPWDLHQRCWQDWQQSVQQSLKIARCYSKKVHLVGFSSGALLALMLAANKANKIASISACSPPINFKDPLINLVKTTHSTNKLIKSLMGIEGIFPFQENTPEHPHINYRHVPIASVNQLLQLIKKTKPRLKKIQCPVLIIQADNDPIIDSSSMQILLSSIDESVLNYQWVTSGRHGILFENTGNTQQIIIDFICKQTK